MDLNKWNIYSQPIKKGAVRVSQESRADISTALIRCHALEMARQCWQQQPGPERFGVDDWWVGRSTETVWQPSALCRWCCLLQRCMSYVVIRNTQLGMAFFVLRILYNPPSLISFILSLFFFGAFSKSLSQLKCGSSISLTFNRKHQF